MGENLEEWMETLNSMNAQNRWRLGLSRDTLTGGGGDIRKSVMVVPFSQNLLVDTDVK